MSSVQELEAAVQRLSPEDRAAFRAWLAEFDAADWDRQLEADAGTGRPASGTLYGPMRHRDTPRF